MLLRYAVLVLATSLLPACDDDAGPMLREAGTRVLFVGNSLTYANDLPGAVATIAAFLGHDVATAGIASANFSLEDHYRAGIGDRIRELAPDIVVLQQGPSSLPENRTYLVQWADSLARLARVAGAEPALYMVWPDLSRFSAFDAVRASYQAAAAAVDGIFLPAGEGMRALHLRHPELSGFGPDGFHPNETGTILVALIIAGGLLGEHLEGIPAQIPAAAGGRSISMTPREHEVLPSLADEILSSYSLPPTPSRVSPAALPRSR